MKERQTQTKIIATIGPASSDEDQIRELIKAGMNVARLNFSHGSHEDHLVVIKRLKKIRDELEKPIAMMLDTRGPEIRTLLDKEIEVKKGDKIRFVEKVSALNDLLLTQPTVIKEIEVPAKVIFDDGYITAIAQKKGRDYIEIEIIEGGTIHSNKTVHILGQTFSIYHLTNKDIEDIRFGLENGVDIIAASFVSHSEHILAIRNLLKEAGKENILVIAKIESREGVNNIDSIIAVADGIMIARGDLGIEMPLAQLPAIQRKLIRTCCLQLKPVIVATQMLESMINSHQPTRAELTDIANAVYEGADCVMLSGETAVGSYPSEAVSMLKEVIRETEKDFDARLFRERLDIQGGSDILSTMSRSSIEIAENINAKMIIVHTVSGKTSMSLGSIPRKIPVLAVTPSLVTYYQTSISRGVTPLLEKFPEIDRGFSYISAYLLHNKMISFGDTVLVTTGRPYGVSHTTNTLMIRMIGDIIAKGKGVLDQTNSVEGSVIHFLSFDPKKN